MPERPDLTRVLHRMADLTDRPADATPRELCGRIGRLRELTRQMAAALDVEDVAAALE